MFNVEWFDKVFIKKDGNCIFRALSVFVNKDLTNCRRKQSGQACNNELNDKEDKLYKALRLIVVTYMELHKNKFINSLQFDDTIYDSIDKRIEGMTNDGEFGGELELYIISKIFKIQINVFVKTSNGFNLVSKIGRDSSNICNLFYENLHYELLVLKPEYLKDYKKNIKSWIKENPNVRFEEIVYSEHSDSEYEIL